MEGNGASDFNVEAGTGQVGTQLPALLLIGLAFGCASCQGKKQEKARIAFLPT
jgi:hypothetical protein